ncbi:hypothetical protein ACQX25_08705 [Corynebacterium diphtheriae]|uniref:hypothetical protein n=1 Tax=Corynebacterium diphtheriae TaxID=1717 RepID=UPI0013CAF7ED|nr:hypothetical protein [Corynebacterium diphtheriae]CAB0574177.1 hypothetical protein CIP107509_02258 [Corynebacterium diphtheriae]CAB0576967.1 hypothetical protein CIP107532_02246 [Corynebacterium diphtheriae]CAB0715888.1 hypothetical protein FRC0049_02189 [Corynebacterium diphtheriae]CAB0716543.1 hypothetical protein FRC0050_02206 [Corynebacterium diphtheriae]CAB0862470.1 hypothetical protein FRC0314_02104 [Corynebacterium diphtheriae]
MLVEQAAHPLDGIQVPVRAEKSTITSVCGRALSGRKSWAQLQDLVGFFAQGIFFAQGNKFLEVQAHRPLAGFLVVRADSHDVPSVLHHALSPTQAGLKTDPD